MIKKLAIFDMDNTISGLFLQHCFFKPLGSRQYTQLFSKEFKNILWHQKIGMAINKTIYKQEDFDNQLKKISLVHGMRSLFVQLKSRGYQIDIMSGSNNYLINKFLQIKSISSYFTNVYANPVNLERGNVIYDKQYIGQCQIETCRLGYCKNINLHKNLRVSDYQDILFIGDGLNDLCAMSQLPKTSGKAFIRRNHELHQNIQLNRQLKNLIKCQTVFWNNGEDIQKYITNKQRN